MIEKGVLYIATGYKYFEEAVKSAKSLKENNKNLHCTLVTDVSIKERIFDNQIIINDATFSFFDKTKYLSYSPYKYTIFLDTDTFILDSLEEIFKILERFDIAMAHAPIRSICDLNSIPESFPEFNTGVIAYRNNENVKKFLINLHMEHKKFFYRKDLRWKIDVNEGNVPDQPVFRYLLYKEKSIQLYVLPPEYNCRFVFPGSIYGKVKILHGHFSYKNMEAIGRKINKQTDSIRCFFPFINTILIFTGFNKINKFLKFIKNIFGNKR